MVLHRPFEPARVIGKVVLVRTYSLPGGHYKIVFFFWNSIVHLTTLEAWPREFCF
jgi:hypothetical protein